jgi:aspartyl-tRNA(Asn)/glutamyl-tRNA(Gln) amidotransferase subunit A
MTDFTWYNATELADLYRTGSASPVAVAEQVLAKIARINPVLNAFCYTDPETTLKQAQASEQRWQQGQPLSVLDGVPVAFKDSILTQGWPTLRGSRTIDPDQPWLEDAPVSARLREAGAVFAGKTSMSEFGSDNRSSNSIAHGVVRNPWNIQHTPGGSSGGSAVAVSAGLVPLAIGSDFGGSISVPSAFCGTMGLKPSFGRVPRYPNNGLNFSTVGPMARSAKDIATVMNTITQPDVRDWMCLPQCDTDYTKDLNKEVRGLRVAYGQSLNSNTNKEIQTAVDTVATWLSAQGAKVKSVDVNVGDLENIFLNLATPDLLQQWTDIPVDRQHLTDRKIQRQSILAHKKIDLYHWINQRKELIVNMHKFMQSYDVIIVPATTVTPEQITDSNKEFFLSLFSLLFYTTQQPAVTVPIGLNSNAMPMAVMIAGAVHNESAVLQVAQALESAFPMPHPPFFY